MLFDNVTIRLLGSDDFPATAKQQAAADLTTAAREGALSIPIGSPFTSTARQRPTTGSTAAPASASWSPSPSEPAAAPSKLASAGPGARGRYRRNVRRYADHPGLVTLGESAVAKGLLESERHHPACGGVSVEHHAERRGDVWAATDRARPGNHQRTGARRGPEGQQPPRRIGASTEIGM